VDFANDTIRVSAKMGSREILAWEPKDYEARAIPVPARTMAFLTQMQQSAPESHAYVFLSAERLAFIRVAQAAGLWKVGRYELNNFHRSLRALVVRAAEEVPSLVDGDGKPTISLHDLRRSAITNWSKAANMQTVMAMAGHSNIETTQRYYASATEDQLDRVRRASQLALETAATHQSDPKVTHSASVSGSLPHPPIISASSDRHLRE